MFKRVCLFALAGLAMGFLAGCGGGSGGSQLNTGSTSAKMAVSAFDSTTGASVNHVAYGNPVTVQAVVTDKTGKAAPGVIVTFAIDETAAATLSQTKVLTDSSGKATVRISANVISTDTAIVVSASTSITSTDKAGTSTTATASASVNMSVGQTTSGTTQGTPAILSYVGATTKRMVIKGASAGSGTLSETSTVSFKVLDSTGAVVSGASVIFDLTSRNGGIQTDGSDSAVTVTSDSGGIAKVTIQSGTLPESFLVFGTLPGSASPTAKYYSNDQLAISSSFPDQSHLKLIWQSGASCPATTGTLTYPCTVVVTLGDFMGHPAPDGTVVTFASAQATIVGTTDAGGTATGYCTTTAGQCTANIVAGDGRGDVIGNWLYPLNHVVAFAKGLSAPASTPITINSYSSAGVIGSTKTVIASPDSDDYIRASLYW